MYPFVFSTLALINTECSAAPKYIPFVGNTQEVIMRAVYESQYRWIKKKKKIIKIIFIFRYSLHLASYTTCFVFTLIGLSKIIVNGMLFSYACFVGERDIITLPLVAIIKLHTLWICVYNFRVFIVFNSIIVTSATPDDVALQTKRT